MSHAREQIRDAVVAALTPLVTTGSRVKDSSPYPEPPGGLPSLIVFTPSEQPNDRFSSLTIQGRTLSLFVVGYAEGVLVDGTLDTIAAEVETALAASGNLGGLVKLIEYQGTAVAITGDAKKRAGEIRLSFNVHYRTKNSDPTQTTA
ncbi:hypothetical protein C3941_23830 [Kaistia algarum]|uniref:hypothetical protein n=1 Tax=Kaistia algarum TaxID=2083279 RepID=UPI000CE774B3|nr:hypothetical protein [Kaistia algarum]MCX5513423.1 hypothetical protein [Kaistia algarum]PPE77429.1 hypothetical protein C3941_23830 [Kaistia algarum]